MSRAMPLFSARMINSTADYERFFHTRSYIQQRSAAFPGPHSNRALMAACGYKKLEKFIKRRAAWDSLARPIPLAYLDSIGVDLNVLALAAEADQAEFAQALALPLAARWASVRLMPAVYADHELPGLLPEAEAVSYMLDQAGRRRLRCCISFGALKTVYVEPDGTTSTSFYPPSLRIEAGFLVTGGDGSAVGTCRLGR